MRRIATTALVLAATGALALGTSPLASAATGTLHIAPNSYTNPSGCYNAQIWPLTIRNNTNETATVYSNPDCRGQVLGTVPPGGSGTFEFGASVYIP
ncbi:hypothetical protein [Allostreptomyces psammosilenae]|uniref:Uncharacterized protein n=1 Tax=Allostreptomyces psammosilenae TaxID=1892865 RepID=A0A853A1N3_9ACTN|nr:hypothetical protein [Allostreptomyces psammosilenae]NYI04328.1 hypothetical protein [Allostreptomyces psammosilenae]